MGAEEGLFTLQGGWGPVWLLTTDDVESTRAPTTPVTWGRGVRKLELS